jgi:hypothetical protein
MHCINLFKLVYANSVKKIYYCKMKHLHQFANQSVLK